MNGTQVLKEIDKALEELSNSDIVKPGLHDKVTITPLLLTTTTIRTTPGAGFMTAKPIQVQCCVYRHQHQFPFSLHHLLLLVVVAAALQDRDQ